MGGTVPASTKNTGETVGASGSVGASYVGVSVCVCVTCAGVCVFVCASLPSGCVREGDGKTAGLRPVLSTDLPGLWSPSPPPSPERAGVGLCPPPSRCWKGRGGQEGPGSAQTPPPPPAAARAGLLLLHSPSHPCCPPPKTQSPPLPRPGASTGRTRGPGLELELVRLGVGGWGWEDPAGIGQASGGPPMAHASVCPPVLERE